MTEEQMAQPITVEFLKKNFGDYSAVNDTFSTTPDQTPVSVDVFPRFGKFTIIVFDEERDDIFTATTIGQLVAFLNLCGLQSFTSALKM